MMFSPHWLIAIGFVLLSLPQVYASRVVRVGEHQLQLAITQLDARNWEVGEDACVIQKDQEVACGEITFSLPQRAYLRLSEQAILEVDKKEKRTKYNGYEISAQFKRVRIKKNDLVIPRHSSAHLFQWIPSVKRPPKERYGWRPPYPKLHQARHDWEGWPFHSNRADRRIASYGEGRLREAYEENGPLPSAALGVGLNYLFPYVHFRNLVSEHVAIGISPLYYLLPKGTGFIHGPGGLITVNYYSTGPFEGIWGQIGFGQLGLTLKNEAGQEIRRTSFTANATFGMRFYSSKGFTFGIGAGVQAFTNGGISTIGVTMPSFLPSLTMELAHTF